MVRDVLGARVYTYGAWRMLEMLVKGERRGGRAPVCAPGAAAFLGSWLSAPGGARGAHQLGTGVPEAVDYLGGI